MKILIDDGLALGKKLTGIGWYTKEIFQALKKEQLQVELKTYPGWFYNCPLILKRVLYLMFFVKKNIKYKYDIIFYTNFYMPSKKHKSETIVTIHDLSPFFVSKTFPFYYRYYAKRTIINSLKHADVVITVSDAVSSEIKKMFPEYHHKVRVIYNSVRDSYLSAQKDLGPKRDFFLYVGVIEKRKNIELLCSAFQLLHKKYPETKLVIVGKPGYGFNQISDKFHNDGVSYKNYISDLELQKLYTRAKAFVFPSLYEGFGKPLVEAMYYQLPVIASDIPTNVELNNRHGHFFSIFNHNNIEELFFAMENVHRNQPELYIYPNLQIYRPDQVAEDLLVVIKEFENARS